MSFLLFLLVIRVIKFAKTFYWFLFKLLIVTKKELDTACEEICGITNKTYSRSRQSVAPDFEGYLKEYSSNLDNPYCLPAPPFKNPMENMHKIVSEGDNGRDLSRDRVLADYDKRGPGLYYVDSDGSRSSGNVFSVDSGSIYPLRVLDTAYKWDLKDEEVFELGRRIIYHTTYRDSYSGSIVRVYDMLAMRDLHFKYEAQKKAAEEEA